MGTTAFHTVLSCKEQLENPNPSLYSEELWEEAKGQCSFSRSIQATIIFGFTSGLSVISAFLIIYLILKLPTRLSSIYHRIMFGMSICQIMSSFPRALSTLPMPAPGDYWTDILNVQGTRLGNIFTCTVQGFLIRFGEISAGSYFIVGLSFYYACAIGFEMDIQTLTKCVEPLIHLFCIVWALQSSVPALFVGGYNVDFGSYCIIAPKPWFCTSDNSTVACERGGVGMGKELLTDKTMKIRYNPVLAAFILICLLIVCCRVYKKDREMDTLLRKSELDNFRRPIKSILVRRGVYRLMNGENISREEIQQRIKNQYKDTKTIVSQSAIYFLLVTCVFTFGFGMSTSTLGMVEIMWSMQGLYQLFIFVFHKVFNQRRHNPNISISDAIIEVFKGGPSNEVFILSGMYVVRAIGKEMESGDRSGCSEVDESTPLMPSYDSLSNNFGSEPLIGTGRSFISSKMAQSVDGNSNMQSNYTNDEVSVSSRYCIEGNNDLAIHSEEDICGLSGFSEEVEDSIRYSLGELCEGDISDDSSASLGLMAT